MIDLHMHTTASDGRCTPDELVRRAYDKGIRAMSVTDHDTMAGVAPASRAADALAMAVIPGIEITTVHRGKDVHMLAYFLNEAAPGLQGLLSGQRRQRVERAMEIADRLAKLGAPIDVQPFIDAASQPGGKAIARPQIAQALIAAGHGRTVVRLRQTSWRLWFRAGALPRWRILATGRRTKSFLA